MSLAHTAVAKALRDGQLVREACRCGRFDQVHAHHEDYSKPLDVVWLCPACHAQHHGQARSVAWETALIRGRVMKVRPAPKWLRAGSP